VTSAGEHRARLLPAELCAGLEAAGETEPLGARRDRRDDGWQAAQDPRRAHLHAAVVLLAYVYAPLQAQLEDVIRFAVLPVLAVTGIVMWQAARIRRTLWAVRATRAPKAHPNKQKGTPSETP
jgi:hypothetical protein